MAATLASVRIRPVRPADLCSFSWCDNSAPSISAPFGRSRRISILSDSNGWPDGCDAVIALEIPMNSLGETEQKWAQEACPDWRSTGDPGILTLFYSQAIRRPRFGPQASRYIRLTNDSPYSCDEVAHVEGSLHPECLRRVARDIGQHGNDDKGNTHGPT